MDQALEESVARDILAGSVMQDEIEQAEQDIDQGPRGWGNCSLVAGGPG